MSEPLHVVLLTLGAGLAMPVGAWCAQLEHIQTRWLQQELRHGILAFGGGALLSAIALVLVPDGIKQLTPLAVACCFIVGGLAFMMLDIWLKKMDTPASQLMAMLADFIPESIALGAAVASGGAHTLLLAILIALQNVPEGFNAFRELKQNSKYSALTVIGSFAFMALLGPLAGLCGYFWLAEAPVWVAAIMLFAAGGILYSIFQDIAPQVKLEKHWAPPMGAILGFVAGLLGYMYS